MGILNPSNAKLNLICHLLALLGVHHILHVSRIRVNELGFFYFHGSTAPSALGAPYCRDSQSHADTLPSVGLLWTSNQPDAETSA